MRVLVPTEVTAPRRGPLLKNPRERMDVLAAYREVGTYRSAAAICGTTHKARGTPQEASMTGRIGDQIMIIPRESHEPVREGVIREIRHDLGGMVYRVHWSDTRQDSFLPHGPDLVIKHRRAGGPGQASAEQTSWLSRLRHPLERRHARDVQRRHQAAYERLAERVEEIITGLGLIEDDHSVSAGRVYHIPEVISVDPGPPLGVDIRMLPGQSPEDFSAHAAAIAYDLGMADVCVVPLGPSDIRLELLPHDWHAGQSPASG